MLLPKDPLQPVPWKKVDELLKILRSDLPRSLQAYGFLQTFVEWKKKGGDSQKHGVYTPHGCFDDGAVVGIYKATDSFYYISMYCISGDFSSLRNALLTTSRIKWDTEGLEVAFEGLAEKLLPIVEECLSRHKLSTTLSVRTVKVWKTPDQLSSCEYKCPCEVRLAPLDSDSSTEIQETWGHGFEGADHHIETLLSNNFGLGVYLRSTGELVAWLLCNQFSALGILFTKKEHRRKGYAQLMCNAMSAQLLESEFLPQANILDTNQPSLKLFGEELKFNSCRNFFYVQAKVPGPKIDSNHDHERLHG